MKLELVLYVIFFFLSAYILMGSRINEVFKQGRVLQARLSLFIISMCISYLATQFIIRFLELTKVL